MSWRDPDPTEESWRRMGRPGGDWRGLRPTFDNPMSWSLPLGQVAGITVRIHIIFLLFIVVTLLRAMVGPAEGQAFTLLGLGIVSMGIASLFVIVLVHEFGHCLACRWTGGGADEILMWPLGGLAFCRPRHAWRSHLVTAVGGPAVNVVFCLVSGVLLGVLTGGWLGVALPNPFSLSEAIFQHRLDRSWALLFLFLINWTSLVLLLFNLLPIFPLDGGRIVQALLWPRVGYRISMRYAVRVGYVGAILLGLWGAVAGQWMLLAIAVFGGITCYITHKQLQFTDAFMDEEYSAVGADPDPEPDRPRRPGRAERREERRRQQAAAETEEVDRVLDKIRTAGIESLDLRERRLLKRATQRRRDGRGD